MKLYRVHMTTMEEGSNGFEWYSSKAAAERAASKFVRNNQPEDEKEDYYANLARRVNAPDRPEVEAVEFPTTKAGILALLNAYASHPDNG